MAYKLLGSAQGRRRRFNRHDLAVDRLPDVNFKNSIRVSDDKTATTDETIAE